MNAVVHIGCAGWAIRPEAAGSFPGDGSHLERYAARFSCVEINSTFYRSHRAATYVRWAASVPAQFRFSVKMPRAITHQARMAGADGLVAAFLGEIAHLADKLGCILIQLPPSLAFDQRVATHFVQMLRHEYEGNVALEPRHASWFGPGAGRLLRAYAISRVHADPPIVAAEAVASHMAYFRLHGSPRMYYSSYSAEQLAGLAREISQTACAETWCIFDNTALGAATSNALMLRGMAGIA